MPLLNRWRSLASRKNILKILIAFVVIHLLINYIPNTVKELNTETFEEKLSHSKPEGHRDELIQGSFDSSLETDFQHDKVDPSLQATHGEENSQNNANHEVKNPGHQDKDSGLKDSSLKFKEGSDQIVNPIKQTDSQKINNEELSIPKPVEEFSSESIQTVSGPNQIELERSFFRKAVDIFLKNKPEGIDKIDLNEKAPSYYYIDIPNPTFNIEFLSQFLDISHKQIDELTKKHTQLKLDILDFQYPKDVFHGKGIVMIGGGSFLGTALTSIRALRETGSQLPLQLMLTTFEEYDKDVCEVLLPKLNSKCIIMEEIVGSETFNSLHLQKYELKVLGLFLSTFEEALLLDADNLAVKDPDYILESKPYNKYGYIIWPDFWRQTISPHFYDIAGIKVGEPIRKDGVPPNEPFPSRENAQLSDLEGTIPDSTCEAGQLAINKKLHFKSLLATVYYNLYGFKYYYHLLGQGAVGIGDKDTFIAGLTVFQEPYYFVKQRPLLFGYDHENGWQDTTMVQYDPSQDFEYYNAANSYMSSHDYDTKTNIFLNYVATNNLREEIHENINLPKPEVQFLHIHSPKFNALKNYLSADYEIDGHERRQFGSREKIASTLPLDWELKLSRISQWLACESEIIPEDWKTVRRSDYCDRIKKHVDFLIQTSDTPEMAVLKDIGV
ncbi:hypothetical protein WICMUC_005200 [Wickerhamomyces mucosus]|uniref:Alpha-1,2-mannosyltransferase n=1 Tax=Wickerhamomyces mucosus TaxID=1378264 RepID=A0A9P8P9Q1_9ASCO|nr:hypothetical protein WICMUC_005200 [Wickerhamomyces mucosus]